MLKSKKIFMVLFLIAGFIFLFGSVKNASAQNSKGIFISTLSKIPGHKIIKDYGLIAIVRDNKSNFLMVNIDGIYYGNSIFNNEVLAVDTFKIINQNKPAGANACINLKFQYGHYASCEYVKLSSGE